MKKKPSPEAQIYEKAWNDYVAQLPDWKKNIIINNFNVIDGHHVYENRTDNRIAKEVAHEVSMIAEEQIQALLPTGKY